MATPGSTAALPPPEQRATVLKAPDGVTLVSSTVVNQQAFANNHGIPLAAVVDFVPPGTLQLPQVSRAPVRCKACSAYLNAYCQRDTTKGEWMCSLCGQANSNQELIHCDQMPELSREAVEYVFPAPKVATQPPPGHLVLVVDATLCESDAPGMVAGVLEGLSALDPTTRVSLITFDSAVNMHSLGCESAGQDGVPPPPFSLTLPGSRELDADMLAAYLNGSVSGLGGSPPQLVSTLGACRDRLASALCSVRPLEGDRPLRQRARATGAALHAALRLMALSPLPGANARRPHRLPRGSRVLLLVAGACTVGPGSMPLAALEAGAGFAPKIASSLTREEQHAVKGADAFVARLSEAAVAAAVPVDVVLLGDLMVDAPRLTSLVADSRGQMLIQRRAGPCLGPALKANFSRCLGTSAVLDCYMSDGLRLVQWLGPVDALSPPDPDDVGLAMAEDRRLSGAACSVPRLQDGRGAALRLEVVRNLDAPAVLVQVVLQFVDQSIGGRFVQRVTTRRLPVVASLGDYMRGINADAACVVAAKKAVIDAKKSGALWQHAKADELRYSLRAQLTLAASRCGKEVKLSSGMLGWGVKRARQWPENLMPLAQVLFQLQRSVLLGPTAQRGRNAGHADARLILANSLLAAGSRATMLMVLPRLYRWRGRTAGLQELPPVDLLPPLLYEPQSGTPPDAMSVLLLDAGPSVMALPTSCLAAAQSREADAMGETDQSTGAGAPPQLPTDTAEALRSQVLALGAGSWPAPELRMLGADGMGELQRLLLPVSRSPLEELQAMHPTLVQLSNTPGELQKVMARVVAAGHDDVTFMQWAHAAGVLVTPPNAGAK